MFASKVFIFVRVPNITITILVAFFFSYYVQQIIFKINPFNNEGM